MINENFVYLGALFALIGTVSYSYEMFRGNARPNRVTWFLWALAPLIAFSAMVSQGVGISALMTFVAGFGPLVIFILSFVTRKSYWKISKLDMVCGVLSIIALLLWALTRVGNVAILLSVIADAFAAMPTIINLGTSQRQKTIVHISLPRSGRSLRF